MTIKKVYGLILTWISTTAGVLTTTTMMSVNVVKIKVDVPGISRCVADAG